MTLRTKSVCCLVTLIIAAMTLPCRADRVYQLVDYPANQNGHTLNGTITTTDNAPTDSVLDLSEILSWQWSITGPNTFAANSTEFLDNTSLALGVQITTQAISLPVADFGDPGPFRLELSRRTSLGGRGQLSHSLAWQSVNTPSAGTTNFSSANRQDGDAVQSFWFGTATFPSSSSWVVAVAIPEPTTMLLTVCAMATIFWRRHATKGNNQDGD
jgi:hypothetical protein